ncbi:MAG: HD-GYP domain-containing protein [Gammaproteobacteria bacterium]|nr:HD-GYP domain-containing protein [Gammaproteobacteria bacterium]MDH3407596.1 HD-GYP domain-containing protein [Gammaproteobacteria bacterium]
MVDIGKKRIDVIDLRPGMYISQLDRPWLESPFLFQGFELRTDEEMDLLRKHCKYVIIDTALGLDVLPLSNRVEYESRMRAIQVEEDQLTAKIRELADSPGRTRTRPAYEDQAPLEQEIPRAREIESSARDVMNDMLRNIQKGKEFSMELVTKVVTNMVNSMIRNPDAMVCLTYMRKISEYTALHSIRTAILGIAFGRHLVFTKDQLIELGVGLMLHDIGMLRIPKNIIEKPSGLDAAEFEIMKRHVGWGVALIKNNGGIPPFAMQVVQQHHERHDGEGYPVRLKGDAISQVGYIASIVDVYDAVTSDRIYSGGMSAEEALKRMYEWREKDFHAELVEDFIRCMGIFPIGSLVELSTGSVGVVISINRARRLKPKVALVLTADKKPYSHKLVTDLMEHTDGKGQEIKISRVLPVGSYGIHPMDHIVRI